MFRVVLAAGAVALAMVAVRHGDVLERTHLVGGCSAIATPSGEAGAWQARRPGKLEGPPGPVAQVVQPPRARRRGRALALPGPAGRIRHGQHLAAVTQAETGPGPRARFSVRPGPGTTLRCDSDEAHGSTPPRSPTSAVAAAADGGWRSAEAASASWASSSCLLVNVLGGGDASALEQWLNQTAGGGLQQVPQTEALSDCRTGADANARRRLPHRRLRQQHPAVLGDEFRPRGDATELAKTTFFTGQVPDRLRRRDARRSGRSTARSTSTSTSTSASSTSSQSRFGAQGGPFAAGVRARARVRPSHPEPDRRARPRSATTGRAPRARPSASSCRPTATPASGPRTRSTPAISSR